RQARRQWAERWLELERLARQAWERALERMAEPFEGRVFPELAACLPRGAVLVAGNSMPVRDLDSFLAPQDGPLRCLANRGASGIDGVVSTALGVAAARVGPVVLVIGDLSFYHDQNGLLAARLHQLSLTVVLVNNDGGGIFHFLPHLRHAEPFEPLFGTPTGLEFRHVVEMYGGRFVPAAGWEQFRSAVRRGVQEGGLHVVELRTDRRRNVELHQQVWEAVARAVQGRVQG
ncbi:MAG TPA: thiamine pyrophosphate-dependent enzyme, partial [Limnochordales bacterium]